MMKKPVLVLFIFFAGTIIFSSKLHAQVVNVRPTEPAYTKPAAPSPKAIWIGPEWRWDGPTHAYVSVPGYWVKPPHERDAWVPGHWISVPGGFQWIAGHWRRVKY